MLGRMSKAVCADCVSKDWMPQPGTRGSANWCSSSHQLTPSQDEKGMAPDTPR